MTRENFPLIGCLLPPRRTQRASASFCQSAYEPVRTDRVLEPRFGPTLSDASPYCPGADLAPFPVEQGQLSARLMHAKQEIFALGLGRAS